MPDTIHLRGVTARGRHGVFDWERQYGQPFVVDADLDLDLKSAGASDDLARTIDYGQVANLIVAEIEGEPRNLIEAVAESIAGGILAKYPTVSRVSVTVHKPQAPIDAVFTDVAVTVVRGRM